MFQTQGTMPEVGIWVMIYQKYNIICKISDSETDSFVRMFYLFSYIQKA